MATITSYGEVMYRVVPSDFGTFKSSPLWKTSLGGSEANILAGLALLGENVYLASFLPRNPLGMRALQELRGFGIGIEGIIMLPDGRMGLYFVEFLNGGGLTEVFYDRSLSSFAISPLTSTQVELVKKGKVFVFTGITPALSETCRNNLKLILSELRPDTIVSFDVNYRGKLWSTKDFRSFFDSIVECLDMLFIQERDFSLIFGDERQDEEALIALQQWFGKNKIYVMTQGAKGCKAIFGETFCEQKAFPTRVVDPFGAGDAFVAGFLHAYISGKTLQEACLWGTAMAAVKLNVFGDMPSFEKRVVEELVLKGCQFWDENIENIKR